MQDIPKKKQQGAGKGAGILSLIVLAAAIAAWQMFGIAGQRAEQQSNSDPKVAQQVVEANNKAMEFVRQHKLTEAEQALEPLLGIKDSVADGAKQQLAVIYVLDNKLDDCSRVCRVLGGGTDQGEADKMHFLGAPMANQNPQLARRVLERSSAMYLKLYGPDSKQYTKDMYNIGFCDWKMGKFDEASKELRAIMPALQKAYGPLDPLTVSAQGTLVASDAHDNGTKK